VRRRERGQKGCRSQGEQHPPLPPYQLTPNLLPVRLPQQGALLPHRTPHPWLHPASGPKPSHMARFWTFDPKAATPGAIERATPPPLPPHTHHPTTSLLRPASPFITAHSKPSPSGSVFGLWPQTRYTCTRSSARPTITTTTSFPTPHQPPPLPSLSVPTGAPETESHRLGFRALTQTRRPCEQSRCPPPPPPPPPHPTPSIAPAVRSHRCTRNRAPSARFSGFGPNPPPLRVIECTHHHHHHHIISCTPPTTSITPSVSIGAPETEPPPLSFGFLAQIPNNGANTA
jgi:hypothetical protein